MRLTQRDLSNRKRAAISGGEKSYLGNECVRHPDLLGERTVWNGACVQCYRENGRIRTKAWRLKNIERCKERERIWRESNRDKIRELERSRYHRDPKRFSENHKRYRSHPHVAAKMRENSSRHKTENRAHHTANQNKRKALQLRATLSNLSGEEFYEFYEVASFLTIIMNRKFHVDHIIPLNGRGVCGLHVPWNLQVIGMIENISKGNRWRPEDGLLILA